MSATRRPHDRISSLRGHGGARARACARRCGRRCRRICGCRCGCRWISYPDGVRLRQNLYSALYLHPHHADADTKEDTNAIENRLQKAWAPVAPANIPPQQTLLHYEYARILTVLPINKILKNMETPAFRPNPRPPASTPAATAKLSVCSTNYPAGNPSSQTPTLPTTPHHALPLAQNPHRHPNRPNTRTPFCGIKKKGISLTPQCLAHHPG